MTSNRPARKVRTESDVLKLNFASLSRVRKANQMEDRRHMMRVADEIKMAENYELAMMERERRKVARELAQLRLQSNQDAARRRQVAIAREIVRQQAIRDSLVPSPLPFVEMDVDPLGRDALMFENSHLMRKERRSRKPSLAKSSRVDMEPVEAAKEEAEAKEMPHSSEQSPKAERKQKTVRTAKISYKKTTDLRRERTFSDGASLRTK